MTHCDISTSVQYIACLWFCCFACLENEVHRCCIVQPKGSTPYLFLAAVHAAFFAQIDEWRSAVWQRAHTLLDISFIDMISQMNDTVFQ